MKLKPKQRSVGKGLTSTPPAAPTRPVELHLVVTRASGDRETYKLGEVPDLRYAIAYRRRLHRITMPKRIAA